MTKKQAQWNSKRDALIAQYGKETLIRAFRLNVDEGEGGTVISEYTKIPMRQVSAAIRVGGELTGVWPYGSW